MWRNDVQLAAAALKEVVHQVTPELKAALDQSPGKMLGVLVATDAQGQRHQLKAFSGEVDNRWSWPGYVPPIGDRTRWEALEAKTVARIEHLTAALETAAPSDVPAMKAERRQLSATLMAAMFDAVFLTSGKGVRIPLRAAWNSNVGMPSGTGDCAIPRLMNAANVQRLKPLAMAEVWWGPDVQERRHLEMQEPCERRCVPILGHLLCGWDDA